MFLSILKLSLLNFRMHFNLGSLFPLPSFLPHLSSLEPLVVEDPYHPGLGLCLPPPMDTPLICFLPTKYIDIPFPLPGAIPSPGEPQGALGGQEDQAQIAQL